MKYVNIDTGEISNGEPKPKDIIDIVKTELSKLGKTQSCGTANINGTEYFVVNNDISDSDIQKILDEVRK